jgi:hypothetical protein
MFRDLKNKGPQYQTQAEKYSQACERIQKQEENFNEIVSIKMSLMDSPISCFKYNYALDSEV